MMPSRKNPAARRHPLIQVLGWLGVVATITAYAGISLEILLPTQPLYQVLNIFAGAAIGLETYLHRDFPPFWLNLIWGSIALISLIRIFISY